MGGRFRPQGSPQILHDLGYEPGARFILVGHSMGAKVATLYAANYPEDIKTLVNIEGHLHPEDPRMARKLVDELDYELHAVKNRRCTDGDTTEGQQSANDDAQVINDAFQRI